MSLYEIPSRVCCFVSLAVNGDLWCLSVRTPLSVGRLLGNQFRVVLRSVEANHDDVAATAVSLTTHGFINYFGMQRFGTQAVSTAAVGKVIHVYTDTYLCIRHVYYTESLHTLPYRHIYICMYNSM